MAETPPRWVGLIRGIGGATHARMSMADLRAGCAAEGLDDVRTVLATGNLLCRAVLPRAEVAGRIGRVIAAHGLANPVLVRTPEEIAATLAANPFPEAADARPAQLLAVFLDGPPAAGAADDLGGLGPERVADAGDALIVDFVAGVGRSKLTPAKIERVTGRIATARNWTTATRLAGFGEGG